MKQLLKMFFAVALLCSPAVSRADCDTACAQTNSCMNCTEICVSNCDTCVSCNNCSTSPCGCATIFIPRPAFDNTALLRTLPFERHVCGDENYGGWGLDVEYQRSFNSSKLAQCLFGSQPLTFQGSDVVGRADTSLRAENFGLPTLFEGGVSFKPRIQNVNMHLVGFMSLNEWAHGLWGRVELTFQHQTRELRGCESLASTSTQERYPDGLFNGGSRVTVEEPFKLARSVGALVPHQSIATALQGNVTWGVIVDPWHYGKFDWCKQHKNGIAGLAGELGYDFVLRENGHLGGFFRFVAPTGNRPDMTTVFSPVVGNGHHWEVGGGLTAHWNFWTCEESSLGLYLDGYATAALSDRQARTFDLCYTDTLNGCYSRYSLLKALSDSEPTDKIYRVSTSILLSGVNYFTRLADVKIPVKGDATLRMLYTSSDWNVGFGFNVYGQAREKVCNVSSFPVGPNPVVLSGLAVGLKGCGDMTSNTESNSTLYTCAPEDTENIPLVNPNIAIIKQLGDTSNMNGVNINVLSGAAPRQLTYKGFVNFDYTWSNCESRPYIGLGVEAEGGSRNCDLAQWGLWFRTGVAY